MSPRKILHLEEHTRLANRATKFCNYFSLLHAIEQTFYSIFPEQTVFPQEQTIYFPLFAQ